jgi:TolB-like protein
MKISIFQSVAFFALATVCVVTAAEPSVQSPAGLAMGTVFNPQRAPAQKTMGLLQRSFLDMVESSEQELQVAFVVDGTNSMAADIAGVRSALRNVVEDLRQYKGDHVTFALVVYRDVGSPSGEVSMLLKEFTADEKALTQAFDKIVPETGEPYFLELPDLGVHEALDKLTWSDSKEASRWILLFGDSPPYDPNFKDTEENGGARRRFDTDLLVNLAARKAVQISCVLCTSRDEERKVYEQVLDRTRQFMNTLSTNSNGLMLDLSYPDIRSALTAAAKKTRVERQRIGLITREEVEAAVQAAVATPRPVAAGQRLRVAVLPHMPLNQMTFDPTHESVQIAAELRQKFKALSSTEVRSTVDVDRALRRVIAANVPPAQMLQALAVQLRVDYVVWGTMQRNTGGLQVRSAIYSKTDGQKVVETSLATNDKLPETQLVGDLVNKMTLTEFKGNQDPVLQNAFAALRSDSKLKAQILTPVSNNVTSRSDLLIGFDALEQALAYPLGDASGVKLLDQAEEALNRAANDDPRNPFTHMLLASCYFNKAQAVGSQGQNAERQKMHEQLTEALKRAFRERDNSQVDLLKTEIEADYNLLVKKDFAEAIRLYGVLARAPNDAKLHTALRAHWMLAGIYSGDWDVDPKLIDAKKARGFLIQILAHWPESSEASFIKTNLRWSDEKGRNQFENFPRQNNAALKNA